MNELIIFKLVTTLLNNDLLMVRRAKNSSTYVVCLLNQKYN